MWYELTMKQSYALAGAVHVAIGKYKELANENPHMRPQLAAWIVELQEISRLLYDDGVSHKPDN